MIIFRNDQNEAISAGDRLREALVFERLSRVGVRKIQAENADQFRLDTFALLHFVEDKPRHVLATTLRERGAFQIVETWRW